MASLMDEPISTREHIFLAAVRNLATLIRLQRAVYAGETRDLDRYSQPASSGLRPSSAAITDQILDLVAGHGRDHPARAQRGGCEVAFRFIGANR